MGMMIGQAGSRGTREHHPAQTKTKSNLKDNKMKEIPIPGIYFISWDMCPFSIFVVSSESITISSIVSRTKEE